MSDALKSNGLPLTWRDWVVITLCAAGMVAGVTAILTPILRY